MRHKEVIALSHFTDIQPGDDGPVAVVDVATSIAAILLSVLEYVREHRRRFPNGPEPGSQAFRELNDATVSLSENQRRDIRSTHEVGASICIESTGYLVIALSNLYQPQVALFGLHAVARAAVETSMKAWWLIDPAVSPETRIARLYVDNMVNLEEMFKVGRLGVEGRKELDRRRKELIARAKQSGLEAHFAEDRRKKRGPRRLDGFGEMRRPSSTFVSGQFFKALGYDGGEYWYRSLSAIVHATAYGLLDYYKAVPVTGTDMATMEPQLPICAVGHVAILSIQSYLGAVELHAQSCGWDSEDVARHRRLFTDEVLAAINVEGKE
jgi:hypothetical protein